MEYRTPLSEAEMEQLVEYTVERVCEATEDVTAPTDLDDIPPEAVQATLEQRVTDLDAVEQDRYDRLFQTVRAGANYRITDS